MATAIFSLVLLIAVAGFIEIGRIFYKGVTVAQTDTTAKQILSQITSDIQNASSVSLAIQNPSADGMHHSYFCAGNARYSINFDILADGTDQDPTNGYGLLRDILPGNSACAAPCSASCQGQEAAFNNPQELLAPNMRIDLVSIEPVAGDDSLRNVRVRVITGDDSYLNIAGQNPPPSNELNYTCDSNLQTSQFCSVSDISNIVFVGDF